MPTYISIVGRFGRQARSRYKLENLPGPQSKANACLDSLLLTQSQTATREAVNTFFNPSGKWADQERANLTAVQEQASILIHPAGAFELMLDPSIDQIAEKFPEVFNSSGPNTRSKKFLAIALYANVHFSAIRHQTKDRGKTRGIFRVCSFVLTLFLFF